LEEKMEELFLETENGIIPIDPEIVRKYKLEKGSRSPFARSRIVGRNGEYPDRVAESGTKKQWLDEQSEHDIEDIDNGILFSTSEILDLAQGVDSDTEDD
jgi:hypothetical protein